MHRIARRDLLRMRMACQFVSHQRQPERIAFSYELAQDYAIPAKHARLDHLSIGKANHERDNPGRRKIDTGGSVAQHRAEPSQTPVCPAADEAEERRRHQATTTPKNGWVSW